MMKKILFLLIMTSSIAFSQTPKHAKSAYNMLKTAKKHQDSSAIFQPKSTENFLPGYRETYYFDGNNFDLVSKNVYAYNNDKLVEDLYLFWNGTEYETYFRRALEYNTSFVRSTFEFWDEENEDWVPNYIDTSFFDSFMNETRYVSYEYDYETEEVVFSYGYVADFILNTNNQPIEITYYDIDPESLTLSLDIREVYDWTNAVNGPTSIIISEWDYFDEEWIDVFRIHNLTWFNFEELLFTYLESQTWDEDAQTWINYESIQTSYFDNGLEEETIEKIWNGMEFQNEFRAIFTIDMNNVYTSGHYYDWDEINEEWELYYGSKNTNTYGPNQELVQQDFETFNEETGDYEDDYRYVFGEHQNVANIALNELNRFVYPNPVEDFLTISIGDEKGKAVILDLTGKQLNEFDLEGDKTSICTSNFKPGVYVLHIQTDKGSSAHKFIKR